MTTVETVTAERPTGSRELGAPQALTAEQVATYQRDGFLVLPAFVDPQLLRQLQDCSHEWVERSRSETASSMVFELEPDHSSDHPRLRRLSFPADHDERYWRFFSDSPIVDVVVDLIGPDVKFHHSKLNFKEPRGGQEIKWHQDIQFWPHTNYDLLTVGLFLDDVTGEMGNVGFVPGSHNGPLFDQYDGEEFVGCLSDADAATAGVEAARFPTGPAGTVTIHNCRTVHGSSANTSDRQRRLLLGAYAPADALAYTHALSISSRYEQVIRGQRAKWARHDPRPGQVPPLVPKSIFSAQATR